MDPTARERRVRLLWNVTFLLGMLFIAVLFGIGVYTDHKPDTWLRYVFGSLALTAGFQLVVFGPDWDRIIARGSSENQKSPIPARAFGIFFMLVGAGMIGMR